MSCGASRRLRLHTVWLTLLSRATALPPRFVSLFLDIPSLSSFFSSSRSLTLWCLIPSRLPLPSHSSRCLLFSVAPHHLLHYFRTSLSLHSAVLLIQSLYFSMDQVFLRSQVFFLFFLPFSPLFYLAYCWIRSDRVEWFCLTREIVSTILRTIMY